MLNFPGISVTVGEMIDALREIAGNDVASLVYDEPDERVRRIVATWPQAWDNEPAYALGIAGDATIHDLDRGYIADRTPGGA